MPTDRKISANTALSVEPDYKDLFVVVDVSDTTDAATGTDKKIIGQILLDGWVMISDTCTYSSADAPTYIISFSADMTGVLQAGDRFSCVHGGVTKYFIITVVGAFSGGATLVTLYGGTTYTLSNTAITSVKYSHSKSPFGFPVAPANWTETFTDTSARIQINPVQNTWYNLGSLTFNVPIGAWRLNYFMLAEAVAATSIVISVFTTLSTSNNSESDPTMTRKTQLANTDIQNNHTLSALLTVASKTVYYINAKTNQVSGAALEIRGDLATTVVRMECAYL